MNLKELQHAVITGLYSLGFRGEIIPHLMALAQEETHWLTPMRTDLRDKQHETVRDVENREYSLGFWQVNVTDKDPQGRDLSYRWGAPTTDKGGLDFSSRESLKDALLNNVDDNLRALALVVSERVRRGQNIYDEWVNSEKKLDNNSQPNWQQEFGDLADKYLPADWDVEDDLELFRRKQFVKPDNIGYNPAGIAEIQAVVGVTVDGFDGTETQEAIEKTEDMTGEDITETLNDYKRMYPDFVTDPWQTGQFNLGPETEDIEPVIYDDQGNIVSGGPEVMVGETASFEGPPTDAPPVMGEEEIVIEDPNRSGQFANPEQDLEESIESKTSKLDILMWEYLRGNPSVLVEHPITGEMVDLVELIEENPLGLEDGTPEMEQWIKSIYYQTDHYQDSEVGRADREYQWNSAGDGEDQWSTRRLDLISNQVEQLEQILGQANINLDDNQIWELAKQSYLQGLNLAEIKDFLVTATTDTGSPLFDFGAGAPAGGTISDFRSSIKDLYRQYLMDPDEELLKRRSQQLFTGETTVDLVEDEMMEQAALLFPAWKDRIEAGKTPLSIVGAYNGIFSSVMGYSPQWDGRHKDMAVQLGGLTVEGQEQMEMAGGDFARWLRQTDEYDQSPRGINNAYELVTGLGRLMGEVA
jgi:hypothetical protein